MENALFIIYVALAALLALGALARLARAKTVHGAACMAMVLLPLALRVLLVK